MLGLITQYLSTLVFILVAHGWTIQYINIEEFDFYLPVLVVVGAMYVLIAAIGRIDDDA